MNQRAPLNERQLAPAGHLSDDQIDDSLIGHLAADAAAHLSACSECQARLAEAEAPLASFRAVTLAWSERRSATLPLQAGLRARSPWSRRLAWGVTAAAAVAAMLALPWGQHPRGAGPGASQAFATVTSAPSSVGTAQTRDAEIAQDNRMLAAIDRELDAPVAMPAGFGLNPESNRRRSRTATDSLQD